MRVFLRSFVFVCAFALLCGCRTRPVVGRELTSEQKQRAYVAVMNALTSCMKSMEERHQVSFSADWRPVFAFVDRQFLNTPTAHGIGGEYDHRDQIIRLNSVYLQRVVEDERFVQSKEFCRILYHELGHALMDQVSRRTGCGVFPCKPLDHTHTYLGERILAEGVASYFELMAGTPYERYTPDIFPASLDDERWKDVHRRNFVLYQGGLYLVYHILHKYKETGLAYIVRNPLVFPDGDLRSAAERYRQAAERELDLPPPLVRRPS